MDNRICLNCNKEYIPNKHNQKFCTINCKKQFNRNIKLKKCLYCNKEFELRVYNKKFCCEECKKNYDIQNKNIEFRNCSVCNKKFIVSKSNIKYCSKNCAIIGKNPTLICKFCSKKFVKYRGAKGVFCSKNCHNGFMTKYKGTIKKCPFCNKKFIINKKNKKYCGKECGEKAGIRSKTCKYKNVILRSTYELRTCNILDKMKEQNEIFSWEYEITKIPYVDKYGKEHKYIVDFTIYDNNKHYHIEVKGRMTDEDQFKIDCALKQNYNIKVWFLNDIKLQEQKLNISTDQVKQLLLNGIINK